VPAATSPILVAEDEEPDAERLEQAFRKAGVINPFVHVTDGSEAIRYLEGAGPYADRRKCPVPIALILDLKMPGINGFEVLQWCRAQPQFRELLVVVLSGHHELRELTKAYQLGANTFLPKPASDADIQHLVWAFPNAWSLSRTPT
jgi:two-component system response regulator